jgi:hypothetical protein
MTTIAERKAAFAIARAEAYEKSLAKHSVTTRSAPAPVSHGLTDAEISRTIAEHKLLADARQEAIGQALGQERARHRKQIGALEAKIDGLELRLDALAHAASKRRTIKAAKRRDGIIDLPVLPLRQRHA